MILRTSPPNINNPFRRSRPAQNTIYCVNGVIPKTSIRKAKADATSIAPNIFTNKLPMVIDML